MFMDWLQPIMTGRASQTEGKENLGIVELAEYKGVKVNVPAVMVQMPR